MTKQAADAIAARLRTLIDEREARVAEWKRLGEALVEVGAYTEAPHFDTYRDIGALIIRMLRLPDTFVSIASRDMVFRIEWTDEDGEGNAMEGDDLSTLAPEAFLEMYYDGIEADDG